MSPFARILALGLAASAAAPSAIAAQVQGARAAPPPARLFASSDVVELTLVADFRSLAGDRDAQSPTRAGTLRFAGKDGVPVELDIEVRTRGNFRLRESTCAFPNLRLKIPPGPGTEGTVFEGQDEIKLVAHCQDRTEYEQNTVEEYLVYRLYNLVTDASFRVRLGRLTYLDVNGAKAPTTRYGFLIEDLEAMAARLGGTVLVAPAVSPLLLDPVAAARLDLFQYMIGNTDFSAVYFHNVEVIRFADGTLQAVPYDFDFAGIVDASYATPDPSIGTRSVRERVYRGFCRPALDMAAVHAFFMERREAITDVFRRQPAMDPRGAERAVRYLDDFFDTIASPRSRESRIERRCRNPTG